MAGGNHFITAGIIGGNARLAPTEMYDMSGIFRLVQCDGLHYKSSDGQACIAEVTDPRVAAIFEIGRLVAPPLGCGLVVLKRLNTRQQARANSSSPRQTFRSCLQYADLLMHCLLQRTRYPAGQIFGVDRTADFYLEDDAQV